MNKQCKECNKEYNSVNTKGSEQLYCSKSCRNKSASKRFQNNLINKHNEQIKLNEEGNNINKQIVEDNGERHFQYSTNSGISNGTKRKNDFEYSGDIINSIKETFEERSKSIFYQLKCEQLEKEVQELKQDIINLEMELEECNSENEEDSNGIISGLMTSFKTDPQNTISFASELITNFIKPKKIA